MTAYLEIAGLNVCLKKGGGRLLRDVSLTVQPGEVHGLVGESGAGKSMIGKAICGLLPGGVEIASGQITLAGQPLYELAEKTRRQLIGQKIAIIPQDPLTALNPCRRIAPQITDRLTHILGWERQKARQRAAELLDEVAIREPERVLAAYPHELSGGMRQRVLIAAAFAAEPDLIIADEPTTALDVTVQKQILRLIADMQARHNTALLFVTHDMGVVAKICQTVTVLYSGLVISQGSAKDLFERADSPAYARSLVAATPRFDRPEASLLPVRAEVLDGLRAQIAESDRLWEAR